MNPLRFVLAVQVFLLTSLPSIAGVPQLLHYQGRLRVSGADFSGTGQFKFALVNGAGSTTYWSNDGTSVSGNQPVAAVSLPVQAGLYSTLLGDATIPGMTALGAGVFANDDVRLRVWFNDGTNGWQQLAPDQRVAAVGYALMAEDVRDGAVTAAKIADGAVTTSKLAPGSVNAAALAPSAVQENLAAAGQGTVPAGATLLSTLPNAPDLLAAGYVASGSINAGDNWTPIEGGTVRDRAASVWTGSEMLIWGDGNEGWRYNPATNTWTAMSTVGQPANREAPLAVWTGTEMIVWGGISGGNVYPATGGRYNPTTNTWAEVTNVNAPEGRVVGTAVWTGTEMLVWGGNNALILGNGARYNPSAGPGGTWTALPTANAPGFRHNHTAVWTGNQMIIYGGRTGAAAYNDGARFNPAGAGTWTAIPPGPSPRYFHTAVWNGTGMMVWGGTDGGGNPTATGSIYVPANNSWTAMPADGAPAARIQHEAVWAGNEMIVWGGSTSSISLVYTSTGGRFAPGTNRWTALSGGTPPTGRVRHNMVWTGAEMIVWGGFNGAGFNTGSKLRTGQNLYLYQRP